MIEKTKKILNKGRTFCSLLTDQSETFDCMAHDLLLAKSHALNVDMITPNSILFMWQKKNRVKISSSFSSYLDLFQGVPHVSILGMLLLSLFLFDFFLFVGEADFMSYTVDNTPHVCSENISATLKNYRSRKNTFWMAFKQFLKDEM